MIISTSEYKGKHCRILPIDSDTLLKVLYINPIKDMDNWENTLWGDAPGTGQPNRSVTVLHATQIQNICWMHNLAPRVIEMIPYQAGGINYVAQIVKRVKGEPDDNFQQVYDKVKRLGELYGFGNEKDDCSRYDVINGQLVDFNTFHFKNGYLDKIRQRYIEYCRYGKKQYHGVAELGIGSVRHNEDRVKWLGLDTLEVENKTVLDCGCAGGFFCRYLYDKGADVIGVDSSGYGSDNPVLGSYLAANMTRRWGIDFLDIDMTQQIPPRADIVLFLSLNFHKIGTPEWLPRVTKELCIFEDNSKNRDAIKTLSKMFKKVKIVGEAPDQDPDKPKPILYCYK